MKVLLVQPDYKRQGGTPQELAEHLLPSYSLILLAQILSKAGHQARVLDPWSNWVITGKGTENDLAKGLAQILHEEKFDLVGVSVYTPVRKEAMELAALAKQAAPGAKIVLGGPHPTRLGQFMLKENPGLIDYVAQGGADQCLPELAESLEGRGKHLSEIAGLVWRNDLGEVISNTKPVFNINVTGQEPVRFESYLQGLPGSRPGRAYIVTTRGCKYYCNFCSQVWKKALFHAEQRSVAEARRLIEEVGVDELVVYDDCLGLSGKHSADIFQEVARFNKKARLIGISHFQLLNPLWLNAFREAGGYGLMVGLESGHMKLRRKMNKHMDDKEICQGVEMVRNIGLKLGIYTMVGFPNEEIAQINSTKRLLEKIAPEQVIATVYDIKPGDMMIEWGIKAQMISETDFLDPERRIINYMSESELEAAAGMADYLETKFSSQVLLKDHDPSWWILGYDQDKRARLRKQAEEALAKCQN